MKTYICSLVVTILVSSACDNGKGLPGPISPDPTPSSPTVYTLSGMVTEMTPSGPTPVEGVLVRDDSFPVGAHQTMTNDAGFYALEYLLSRPASPNHLVTISKDGYETDRRSVAWSANARLDLQLRRLPTLSGVVFEVTASGRVPIEGVQVYCDGCGHDFQRTDANGHYFFEWATNGAMPLLVDKPGYALAGSQPLGSMSGFIVATVEGATRFDIELVRR